VLAQVSCRCCLQQLSLARVSWPTALLAALVECCRHVCIFTYGYSQRLIPTLAARQDLALAEAAASAACSHLTCLHLSLQAALHHPALTTACSRREDAALLQLTSLDMLLLVSQQQLSGRSAAALPRRTLQ
jgi:hypothetical protein